MLSYLEASKNLVPIEIYQRGIKYYLEGNVLGFEDLILDYWRLYKVKGKNTYEIKIPILHLTINPDKFNKADIALEQSSSCDCPYFIEYGLCKHIVAVCASLEKEFNDPQKKLNQKTVLDSIFEASEKKIKQEFLSKLDIFMNSSKSQNLTWLEKFIIESKNKENYKEFLSDLQPKFINYLDTFEHEQKMMQILPISMQFGGFSWWQVWKSVITKFLPQNQVKIYISLWRMNLANLFLDFKADFIDNIRNLEENIKLEIIFKLKEDFSNLPEYYISFGIKSQCSTWLKSNLEFFDPLKLLEIVEFKSDWQDEIERLIFRQIQIWSDFLTSNSDYREILETIDKWQKVLGRSDLFEDAIKYLKQNHNKKRRFLSQLEKIL
jgi:uncharacterized Zn finger protein